MRKKEGPPESWKNKGRLECRWLGKKALLRAGKIRETVVWIVGKEGPPESWKDKGDWSVDSWERRPS